MADHEIAQETARAQSSAARGPTRSTDGNGAKGSSTDFSNDQGVRAARDAAQVNAELVGRSLHTAQQAFAMGMESTARTFERIAQTLHHAFGADADGSGKDVALNLNAAAQAGVGLAISAQEAYQVWVELTEQRVRTNLQALDELARCRTVQDIASVQTRVIRDNLELALTAGRAIAKASQRSLENAASAIEQSGAGR